MIRWLVRKVVKYVLEELVKSDDLQWLVRRYQTGASTGVGRTESAPGVKPSVGGVEVDSMKDLAAAMTAKTSEIEIDIKNESETVSSNKERSADVMRRLSEIGD